LPKDFELREQRPKTLGEFRPIHYLGSKLRLLPEIEKLVDELDPGKGRVCDLFSGSGTVSYFLSKQRPVTSVDIQEYATLLSRVLLSSEGVLDDQDFDNICNSLMHSKAYQDLSLALEPLIELENLCFDEAAQGKPENLCDLIESGSIYAYQSGYFGNADLRVTDAVRIVSDRLAKLNFAQKNGALITRYFGGAYFSYKQSMIFDLVLEKIAIVRNKPARSYMRAALLSAMSDTVNTVGRQFAQPIRPRTKDGKPKLNLIKKIIFDRTTDVGPVFESWLDKYVNLPRTSFAHIVFKGDYMKYLNSVGGKDAPSIVYADPPYTRDHYSRFYHVLETVCLEDEPVLTTVKGKEGMSISRGLYRSDRHQSPFSIISAAPQAFKDLFSGVAKLNAPLLLSYSPFSSEVESRPRVIGMDDLLSLAKQSYRNVDIVSAVGIAHSKLNHSELNFSKPEKAELFIMCRN
jgi:adenine-specific DNA methylase